MFVEGKHLVISLGEQKCALPVKDIQEVIRVGDVKIAPLPRSPREVKGVINLRGKIIPVIDLEEKLGMKKTKKSRIVVLSLEGRYFGIFATDVLKVMEIEKKQISPLPETAQSARDHFSGLANLEGEMHFLLNINEIFKGGKNG